MSKNASLALMLQPLMDSHHKVESPNTIWESLIRDAKRCGVDIQRFLPIILSMAHDSDELMQERERVQMTLRFKAYFIGIICFVVRCLLVEPDGTLPLGLGRTDMIMVFFSAALCAWVCRASAQACPIPWTLKRAGMHPSHEFMAWISSLILDRMRIDERMQRPNWQALQRDFLQALQWERRDGICRREQRTLMLTAWANQSMQRDRYGIRRFLMFLPATELLMAMLFAVGFCGLPLVDFLGSDVRLG